MKTIGTIHDMLDGNASNFLCHIEGTISRVVNAYMPSELYTTWEDIERDIESALGEAWDNIADIDAGKIQDPDGLLRDISEACIPLLEAYRTAIRLANSGA